MILAGAGWVAGLFGLFANEVIKENPCILQSLSGQAAVETQAPSGAGLTVKNEPISAEQLQYATTIVEVAVSLGLPTRAAEVAIMTAIQESVLYNIPYGDRDSIGLFQQRKEWAPRRVRLNPKKSAGMFYTGGRGGQPGLIDITGWESMPRGDAAQTVQVSATPTAYATHEDEAIAIVAHILGDANVVQTSAECEESDSLDPIERMVQVAEAQVNGLANGPGTLRVGTYNVHGRSHTPGDGWIGRMRRSVQLIRDTQIDVVALQEFEPVQRQEFLRLTNGADRVTEDEWAVFPKEPTYGGSNNASVNSIAYNTSKLRLIEQVSRTTPMPYYFGGSRKQIPLAKFEVIDPDNPDIGKVFWFSSTHDPAFEENAYWRYQDALAQSTHDEELVARTGDPMIKGGDYNAFQNLRYVNNTTFQGKHENITTCVQTASGVFRHVDPDPAVQNRLGCRAETAKGVQLGQVDHLFRTESVKVHQYKVEPRDRATSDHPLVWAEVSFGSSVETRKFDSSGQLVHYSAGEAGFSAPADLTQLASYTGDEESGITAELLDVPGVRNGSLPLKRGDIVFKDQNGQLSEVGIVTNASTATGVSYIGVNNGGAAKRLEVGLQGIALVLRLESLTTASGEWVFPLAEGTYNISSPYGPRDLNGDDFHNGADYGTNGVEAPLVAMHRGTVLRAQFDDAWGNYLLVETNIPVEGMPGSTYKYMYAHLSRYELGLTLGQKLEAGDSVGNVGDTGNSLGEHLHLNICTSLDCLNGDPEGTVDPADFLRSVGITP